MTGNPDLLAKILKEVSSYLSRSNPQASHGCIHSPIWRPRSDSCKMGKRRVNARVELGEETT